MQYQIYQLYTKPLKRYRTPCNLGPHSTKVKRNCLWVGVHQNDAKVHELQETVKFAVKTMWFCHTCISAKKEGEESDQNS